MPDSTPPLLTAHGLGVRRNGRVLLQDVDLEIRRGELVTLIGPNGAGKTTLIRTLLGLIRPDTGEVRRMADLRIGYVPQNLHFDATLPLDVNRLMTLTVRPSPQAVKTALVEAGVDHLRNVQVGHLSSGELQRVLLARSLMRKPDLLVLDEPLQGVDFTGEIDLCELIIAIAKRRRCGVLLVSHDLHIVLDVTDRVVCLNRHVCCTGVPQEVLEHAEFHRLFGPHAAVYRHNHDHRHDLGGSVVSDHESQ